MPRRLRRLPTYLWAGPTTTAGLLLATLARLGGGQARVVDGVVEAHGGLLEALLRRVPIAGGASAMTLGHVVIGRSQNDLDRTRRHERVHVAQYERWGPFFVPAYFFACAVAWKRGHRTYFDCRFEREAYAADGAPVRSIARRPPGIRWLRRVGAVLVSASIAVGVGLGLSFTGDGLSTSTASLAAVTLGLCLAVSLVFSEA